MITKIYHITIYCLIFCGGLFLLLFPLHCQAVTVGPVKIELAGDPGDTLTGEFMVMNETNGPQTYHSIFETYTVVEGQAGKNFLGLARDLATWIQTDKSVTLDSKEHRKIPFTVKIPEDAPAGSLFCVVWWRTGLPPDQAEGNQQLSILTQAGVLMLLTVSGDIVEEMQLKDFKIPGDTTILNYFPPTIEVSTENTGNSYTKPTGQIVINNLFGRPKRNLEVNHIEIEVYPKTSRSLRVTLPAPDPKNPPAEPKIINEPGFLNALKNEWNNFGLGSYTANLDLTYGQESSKKIESTLKFYVIPWRILTISGIALVLLLLIFTKGIKTYNRWIIHQAQILQEQNEKEI